MLDNALPALAIKQLPSIFAGVVAAIGFGEKRADQPVARAAIGHDLDELDMRQELPNLDGIDIPASRHAAATALASPIGDRLSKDRIGPIVIDHQAPHATPALT
jgi:hypothetical protein